MPAELRQTSEEAEWERQWIAGHHHSNLTFVCIVRII